ncbi:MAG: hypothetical protein AB7U83_24475 [Vicinamibacterales bacterium]
MVSGRRTTRILVAAAIAVGALLVYAAMGPLRGWLAHTMHGR